MGENIVLGILAHVDAGKTTLAEAILYRSGVIRRLGRVDRGDTALDTHALERARGITIFASGSVFPLGDMTATLLDTPGHVDFSSETERTLRVLDAAILVVSASEGVQAHTRTLWRLLALYRVPTVLFVTKMDFARETEANVMLGLRREFGDGCVDFSDADEEARAEAVAMRREDLLDKYLTQGSLDVEDTAQLVRQRLLFPCFFGSGLRVEGIDEFLAALPRILRPRIYPERFGARVFKIGRDPQGVRLTHMKITGGTLSVRDTVSAAGTEEKISQIRVYSGARFTSKETARAGEIVAVTGPESLKSGDGLGYEAQAEAPSLEPVMEYRICLPEGCDVRETLPKLKQLEEEDPLLRITWKSAVAEIHCELMGDIQAEILHALILDRFGIDTVIDSGSVLYKETISDTVEGVGHYEPLRHYAEVHLLLEPLPRGHGLVFQSSVSEDDLSRNWQRLILTHLAEKQHLGVLTGAPITDMRITLAAGRAHPKHTEGGDFRQATYRAVRQGLMQAQSVLLEPYLSFRIEVPPEQIGRAITDVRLRGGTFDPPEDAGGLTLLNGRAPATALNGYAAELAAYTGGRGRMSTAPAGYDLCRNAEEVIRRAAYSPTADTENTPDSVFCAHGAGFVVPWDRVSGAMHLPSCLHTEGEEIAVPYSHRNLKLDESELEAIMLREFGPIRRKTYTEKRTVDAGTAERETAARVRTDVWIVDGYNVIFAWDDLRTLAETDLEAARVRLADILANFAAFTQNEVILVFDAYRVAGNPGKHFDRGDVHVVYTKERELGDVYISRLLSEIGKNDRVRVVSSDGLIQLGAVRFGVLRMSAAEFEREVDAVDARIGEILSEMKKEKGETVGEALAARNAAPMQGSPADPQQ